MSKLLTFKMNQKNQVQTALKGIGHSAFDDRDGHNVRYHEKDEPKIKSALAKHGLAPHDKDNAEASSKVKTRDFGAMAVGASMTKRSQEIKNNQREREKRMRKEAVELDEISDAHKAAAKEIHHALFQNVIPPGSDNHFVKQVLKGHGLGDKDRHTVLKHVRTMGYEGPRLREDINEAKPSTVQRDKNGSIITVYKKKDEANNCDLSDIEKGKLPSASRNIKDTDNVDVDLENKKTIGEMILAIASKDAVLVKETFGAMLRGRIDALIEMRKEELANKLLKNHGED